MILTDTSAVNSIIVPQIGQKAITDCDEVDMIAQPERGICQIMKSGATFGQVVMSGNK